MKKLLVVFALFSIISASILAQNGTRIPMTPLSELTPIEKAALPIDIDKLNRKVASEQEIVGDGTFVIIGGIVGFMAGELINTAIWSKSITVATQVPAHYVFDSATGNSVFIPESTAYSSSIEDTSPNGVLSNAWTAAGNAAIGAALSVGIYELGHRVLRWW